MFGYLRLEVQAPFHGSPDYKRAIRGSQAEISAGIRFWTAISKQKCAKNEITTE
jgi:hypothetical protein